MRSNYNPLDVTISSSSAQLSAVDMITTVVQWLAPVLLVGGGVIPYVPQYLQIKRTRNVEGFSLYVCLTLLIANTLRILFWFGHPFELPLLLQSIVMNVTMLAMVHVYVETKNRYSNDFFASRQITFIDFDVDNFWKWTDFISYVQFVIVFTMAGAAIAYLFSGSSMFVEGLGFSALCIEAMLGVPQFYHNLQNKSTEGMSVKMVILWTFGDVFKTLYFVIRNAPYQFWVCGILQISLDTAILGQVFLYRV